MENIAFLIIVGILIASFPVALIVAITLVAKRQGQIRRWKRFLVEQGFAEREAGRGTVESISSSPGKLMDVWAHDREEGTVYRYRKRIASGSGGSSLSQNKTSEEIAWPWSGEQYESIPSVTIAFAAQTGKGKVQEALIRGLERYFSKKYQIERPDPELAGAGAQLVLVDKDHPAPGQWKERISSKLMPALKTALEVGIQFMHISDQYTIIGFDLNRFKASSEERWAVLQRLCTER